MEREIYLSSYSNLETASEANKNFVDGPVIICLSAGSFNPSLEIDDMSVVLSLLPSIILVTKLIEFCWFAMCLFPSEIILFLSTA